MSAPPLSPIAIFRGVLASYRRHWGALLIVGLVVFGIAGLVDTFLPEASIDRFTLGLLAGLLAAAAASSSVHAFGEAFYEGVVASEALEWRTGRPTPSARELLRSVPYIPLISVNVVLALGTGAGLLALVVPGIVFSTYSGLAPALTKLEHLGVRAAFRRSWELVRGSFWRVLVILWGAYLVTLAVSDTVEHLLEHYLAEYLASTVVEAALAPFYGLAAVLVAFELIARERREAEEA